MTEKRTLINTAENMQWLRAVHLPRLLAKYKSAIIVGDENCPDRIEVYVRQDPRSTDAPVVFAVDEDGDFAVQKTRAKPLQSPASSQPARSRDRRSNAQTAVTRKTPPAQLEREITEALTGSGDARRGASDASPRGLRTWARFGVPGS